MSPCGLLPRWNGRCGDGERAHPLGPAVDDHLDGVLAWVVLSGRVLGHRNRLANERGRARFECQLSALEHLGARRAVGPDEVQPHIDEHAARALARVVDGDFDLDLVTDRHRRRFDRHRSDPSGRVGAVAEYVERTWIAVP